MTNKEKYCKYIKKIKQFFRHCIVDCSKKIYAFILFLLCIKPKKEEENKSHELLKLEENSDIKNLKENLNRYLKDSSSKGFVISIKGNWGVGKTFFWNIYAKENLDEKKYVYISLFGINKLDEIKTKILNKISKQANIVNKTKGFFGSSRIVGVDIGAVISIFGIKNFKDIVVCFDDFERLSPNLNISEVLGVISELKEQYSCKIVIINNNDQLEELDRLNRNLIFTKNQETHRLSLSKTNNNEIFKKYLEKIVDVEYEYFPEVKYQIELFKKTYFDKKYINWDLLVDLFNRLEEDKKRNIRLIKQYFFKLEKLEYILGEEVMEDLEDFFIDEFLIKIFEILFKINILNKDVIVFKSLSNMNNINKLYIKEIVENTIIDKEKLKRKILEDIEIARENIKKRDKVNQIQKENEDYKKKIEDTYLRYISDLEYDKDTFIKEFYELLNGKENIIEFTYFNRFTFFIKDCLIEIDKEKEDEFKKFYIEKAKKYFDTRYKNMERYFFQQAYFLDDESRNELFDYYNGLIKGDIEIEKQQINQLDILDSMVKIIEQNSNNTEERMLDNISKQEHKRRLEKYDSPYFKTTFDLMRFLKDSYKLKNLENFYNTTLEIYKDLYKDKDYKYRDKIRLILKDFGIKIKEENKEVEDDK
ncbi:P-loop NTPase fold protein [Arcobacter porcinus]|uniref:P-loop NTPase fold protein n=1 Tax=Arcobacter porcinus TaxID=1935204 RepID=UPI0008271AB1|nr:P-loop NTPase fold protein [Arcobacter porcinus]OCL85620.1 KAP family P-loop domain protein [Arcobacter porcinus]